MVKIDMERYLAFHNRVYGMLEFVANKTPCTCPNDCASCEAKDVIQEITFR